MPLVLRTLGSDAIYPFAMAPEPTGWTTGSRSTPRVCRRSAVYSWGGLRPLLPLCLVSATYSYSTVYEVCEILVDSTSTWRTRVFFAPPRVFAPTRNATSLRPTTTRRTRGTRRSMECSSRSPPPALSCARSPLLPAASQSSWANHMRPCSSTSSSSTRRIRATLWTHRRRSSLATGMLWSAHLRVFKYKIQTVIVYLCSSLAS